MTAKGVDLDLVDRLQATITELDSYVERRAEQIAQPRIAIAEQAAADTVARLGEEHAAELARLRDLESELRRVLAVRDRMYEQLAEHHNSSHTDCAHPSPLPH